MDKLRLLLLAPNVDATDVGEAYVAFKWAEALSAITDLTLLAFQRPGRPPVGAQLPRARVITWPEPDWLVRHERINAMLKPGWPIYCRKARAWIAEATQAGDRFDIAHQLMPQAARYASPLVDTGIPYVIGPLGGAMSTPPAFQDEARSAPLFTRLRALDEFRLRHDPWLRRSYSGAAMVLGVAPYMQEILSPVELQRFEPVLELGIDSLAPLVGRDAAAGRLRLLHVGRGVRTKGLRDVVRALAHLGAMPGVTLTSAGGGEEIEICRREAERLGVADRVTFLGRVERSEVERLYETHDAFAFPSFREPAGGVLYEAMRWGLPVIAARRGGPDWIVDHSCGLKVEVTTPGAFALDLAEATRKLALDPGLRRRLGENARRKVEAEGLWPAKAARMEALYRDCLQDRRRTAA